MSDPLDKISGAGRGFEPALENLKKVFRLDADGRGGGEYAGGFGGSAPEEKDGSEEKAEETPAAHRIPDEIHDDVRLSDSARTMLAPPSEASIPAPPAEAGADGEKTPGLPGDEVPPPEAGPSTVSHVNLTA